MSASAMRCEGAEEIEIVLRMRGDSINGSTGSALRHASPERESATPCGRSFADCP